MSTAVFSGAHQAAWVSAHLVLKDAATLFSKSGCISDSSVTLLTHVFFSEV